MGQWRNAFASGRSQWAAAVWAGWGTMHTTRLLCEAVGVATRCLTHHAMPALYPVSASVCPPPLYVGISLG